LKLPEGCKLPTAQELQGRSYCKWHNYFTHNTNNCKELRRKILSAIEQGRLILGQYVMKVNTQPFPSVNMVEDADRTARRQLDFTFGINMVGPAWSRDEKKKRADPCDRPQIGEKDYITEEQVRHIRNQRPASTHLLRKYEYQYQQRRQHESEEEEYERRTGRSLKMREDTRDHWHCPFFRYCWESGMSQLPTSDNCPECKIQKRDPGEVSVFNRLGPAPPRPEHAGSSRREDPEEEEEEEDKYHQPRWCPDGLIHSQKRRVQRLHCLEEAEAKYLEMLRKARPDLVEKVHHARKGNHTLPRKSGAQSKQEPMQRHQPMHTWCLFSLRSSTLRAMRSCR
jgi:hypothetical protein